MEHEFPFKSVNVLRTRFVYVCICAVGKATMPFGLTDSIFIFNDICSPFHWKKSQTPGIVKSTLVGCIFLFNSFVFANIRLTKLCLC